MDITHDNVCSSMLSCFYSHLLSTGRPISSLLLDLYILGTGQYSWCLGIESILMKYYDMILQPPLRLSTHIMEASVKKY